jgi:hypothetical protein
MQPAPGMQSSSLPTLLPICFLLGAAALVGCTGSTPTPTPGTCKVQGTVRGQSFNAVDCLSHPLTWKAESPYSGELHIYTFASACSKFMAQAYQSNAGEIQILFGSHQLTPGTYLAVLAGGIFPDAGPSQPFVDAHVERSNASCQIPYPYPVYPTDGSVTVTHVDSSGITGTFDMTFGSEHLTGTFDAPTCGPRSSPSSCN